MDTQETNTDLIIKNQTGDSITLTNWSSGDYGIELEQPTIETPEMDFQDWSSDSGNMSWENINWDGSLGTLGKWQLNLICQKQKY